MTTDYKESMMENSITKKCSKCNTYKPLSDFSKQASKKSGLRPSCQSCEKEYRLQHKDQIKETKARYYKENKETIKESFHRYKEKIISEFRERQKAYRERHKEEIKAYREKTREERNTYMASWHKKNKEHTSAYKKSDAGKHSNHMSEIKRRSKLKDAGSFTLEEWKNLCAQYGNKCLCCGRTDVQLTKDHIVPIDSLGKNTIDNIQPLCGSCNSSKGTKTIDYR